MKKVFALMNEAGEIVSLHETSEQGEAAYIDNFLNGGPVLTEQEFTLHKLQDATREQMHAHNCVRYCDSGYKFYPQWIDLYLTSAKNVCNPAIVRYLAKRYIERNERSHILTRYNQLNELYPLFA